MNYKGFAALTGLILFAAVALTVAFVGFSPAKADGGPLGNAESLLAQPGAGCSVPTGTPAPGTKQCSTSQRVDCTCYYNGTAWQCRKCSTGCDPNTGDCRRRPMAPNPIKEAVPTLSPN